MPRSGSTELRMGHDDSAVWVMHAGILSMLFQHTHPWRRAVLSCCDPILGQLQLVVLHPHLLSHRTFNLERPAVSPVLRSKTQPDPQMARWSRE